MSVELIARGETPKARRSIEVPEIERVLLTAGLDAEGRIIVRYATGAGEWALRSEMMWPTRGRAARLSTVIANAARYLATARAVGRPWKTRGR
jgi:hypothetical protein